VNGLESFYPSGWNHWAGFSSSAGTYNYYNSTPYNITFDRTGTIPQTSTASYPMTGVHQAEFVGEWGVTQMNVAKQAGLPFFVHLTPLMIHMGVCYGPLTGGPAGQLNHALDDPYWEKNLTAWGCEPGAMKPCSFTASPCVTEKHKHAFDGVLNPHVPSFNESVIGDMSTEMKRYSPVSDYASNRMDIAYRNRSAALLDLDMLIGVVLDGIEALGELENTYVIFSSDNGYHLGEKKLPFGKEHPYETDVSLPMYIMGPGVPPNSKLQYPTTHIDITATIVELAGATVTGPPLDGLSFASVFTTSPPPDPQAWRDFQFSEFHCDNITWRQVRRPFVNTTYAMWCDATTEVFDLNNDPWQLTNINKVPAGLPIVETDGMIAEAMWKCIGDTCRNPVPMTTKPFKCYKVSGDKAEFDP
jgi:hypothetical protein